MKEQLKRLYQTGIIGVNELLNAVKKTTVTLADIIDIVGENAADDLIKAAKIAEISQACNDAIVAGIDIELGGETVHFNLSIEDQSNINNLFRVVELGGSEFPYQADGGVCRVYSAAEIVQIYIASQALITTQTTYHNELKSYVQSLTDADKISEVSYGMTLPKKYRTEMEAKMAVAQSQMDAIMARLSNAVSTDAKK